MLNDSKIYSFLSENDDFSVHFFDGQKLIHDLIILHHLKGQGFQFFRDAVLSIQPMISFLKPTEGLGFYIDSKIPYFCFKIETNFEGNMRTLLIPEDFDELPSHITGVSRLTKILPPPQTAYTSVIELSNTALGNIVNKIITESYQMNCHIEVSEDSDQSIMIMRLPDTRAERTPPSLEDYWEKMGPKIMDMAKKAPSSLLELEPHFSPLGFKFIGERKVKFHCPCSIERMIKGVKGLVNSTSLEEVFIDNSDSLETNCDYCKTTYLITKDLVRN
jgi:molecular chaperone Hsp33